MGEIRGTNVAAVIAPFTTDDTYATHDAEYGKGGYRTVENITDRDNIPEARRTIGMLVYVVSDDKIYKLLKNNNDEWYWDELTTGGSGGVNSYTHNQDSPSSTWIIEHNLGRYPSAVTIMIEDKDINNNVIEVPATGDIKYININRIQIDFTGENSGKDGYSGEGYKGHAYLI